MSFFFFIHYWRFILNFARPNYTELITNLGILVQLTSAWFLLRRLNFQFQPFFLNVFNFCCYQCGWSTSLGPLEQEVEPGRLIKGQHLLWSSVRRCGWKWFSGLLHEVPDVSLVRWGPTVRPRRHWKARGKAKALGFGFRATVPIWTPALAEYGLGYPSVRTQTHGWVSERHRKMSKACMD